MESLGDVLKKLGIEAPPELGRLDHTPSTGADCESWCKGRGYLRTGSTFSEASAGQVRSLAETVRGISYEYCSCPAGEAARERHEDARKVLFAKAAQREAARIWEDADIPPKLRRYSLESYLNLPGAHPGLVEMLRRWQRTRCWLLLFGDVGTRKTGLAVSLLREALTAGQSGLYVPLPTFLARIRESYRRAADDSDVGESEVLSSAIGVDFLVIDDVGAVSLTDWGREKLFTVLNQRDVRELRTCITTNLAPAELEDHIGKRSYDRIRDNCVDQAAGESFVVELAGPSRRGLLL